MAKGIVYDPRPYQNNGYGSEINEGQRLENQYSNMALANSVASKYGFKGPYDNQKSDSSSIGGGSGGGSNSSNLFGNLGDAAGTFNQFADQNISRAKDWAQFQLGLNQQQGEQDYGFRNREATRDFGFQTALAGQQIEGNKSLESLRQNSETDRLQRSLTSQQTMQQADFSNQTQQRAQAAALARVGFGGR